MKYMTDSKEIAVAVARQLDNKKAANVTIIDIMSKSSFADYFVIATGASNRQLGSLVDYVEDILEPRDIHPKRIEGQPCCQPSALHNRFFLAPMLRQLLLP